ncbi:hypothetical protein A4W84_05945 [Latilactobacillus sakei]|uniref:hypothetical protein n=1 Tax=Latilactobacillus sakei TaxID=1599 RepID=UPI0020732CE7|nr:hypothetical protein [Latilactobacillus sakei]USG09947.1 hypothetical protein A4W84_05945 [Latilactobacillus sakei]
MVTTLYETLDGFGQTLALDGKIIPSYATKPNKKVEHDGRRDTEADFTLKQYTTTTANGEKITKKKTWFGYRLHLIVDANYELSVAYEVTKASEGERLLCQESGHKSTNKFDFQFKLLNLIFGGRSFSPVQILKTL